jgi:hypothetical protein
LLLLLHTIIQIQFKQVFAVYCHKKWKCLFRYDALGIVSFCWQHFVMTEAGIFHARCNTQFGALACVCSFAPSGRKSPATALRWNIGKDGLQKVLDKAHERLYMQETCGSDFSGNFVPCVCRRQLILMYVYEHMYIYICIYIRIYDICVCAIFKIY